MTIVSGSFPNKSTNLTMLMAKIEHQTKDPAQTDPYENWIKQKFNEIENVNNLVVSRNYADYSTVAVKQNYHVALSNSAAMHKTNILMKRETD